MTWLTNGDVVIVVYCDQVAKLQMTSSARSLACNAFHSAAITEEDVRVVVEQFKSRLVEDSSGVCLRHRQAYSI